MLREFSLIELLDFLSIFIFALVGSRVAADKGLDYGGISLVAFIAAVAGGTLRNVFLGIPPVWITDYFMLLAVIAAVIFTLLLRRVTRIGKTLLVMDTFGLSIAAVSGSYLALENSVGWLPAILLGVITAVTGGLLRDVLCQLEPVLLHRETLGTSALLGSVVFVVLAQLGAADSTAAIIGGLVVVLMRFISIKMDWHLPKFR
ncbi:MAG: hypothetical protein GM45_1480 [actinobacterium acAMD-5]|jgi:uncharacterized membrane protein YeiH|nr:MAG: hypothetical protein GM45_1480 [actinobacterium acAMD-5]